MVIWHYTLPMRIELCDICEKKVTGVGRGFSVGRGSLLRTSRLCDTCGKELEPIIKKIEAAESKRKDK